MEKENTEVVIHKFRFTIARKLIFGFGILLITITLTNWLIYDTLDKNLDYNLGVITKVYSPSSAHLNDLYWLVTQTKILIKNWVYIERKDDTPDKNRLRELHARDIPETENALEQLVDYWNENDQDTYREAIQAIDSLVQMHQSIMGQLNSFENYEDMMITFPIYIQTEEDGEVMVLTKSILDRLSTLIGNQESIIDRTNSKMQQDFAYLQTLIFVMAFILILSVIIIGYWTHRSLVNPLNSIKQLIHQMGKGILPKEKIKETTDEIGEMSMALNLWVDGLKKTSEFSLRIGESDFTSEFKPLSDQDVLGNSLILMRENLKKAALEEEKRKREDRQRSWAAQGLAKFGEILRGSNDDMEEFSFRIISNLVKYLDANVGGFYIINNEDTDDRHIELVACYAYGRQKYLKKRIELGVNIIGQSVQEKATIFLTEIPGDYIKINSGLGADTPRSLLVVPLKMNEFVYGVVEIASFNIIESYQIEFVEKLGESIASTISSVKINIHTAKLLSESQEKSERLALQEEKIRQSIELMQATQEELKQQVKEERQKNTKLSHEYKEKIQRIEAKLKKQQEKLTKQEVGLRGLSEALNNSIGIIELSIQGEFLYTNTRFLALAEIEADLILNKQQVSFMLKEKTRSEEFQNLWSDINKGLGKMFINQYFFNGVEKWFKETYTPVKDENGVFYKIIVMAEIISIEDAKKLMVLEKEDIALKTENITEPIEPIEPNDEVSDSLSEKNTEEVDEDAPKERTRKERKREKSDDDDDE